VQALVARSESQGRMADSEPQLCKPEAGADLSHEYPKPWLALVTSEDSGPWTLRAADRNGRTQTQWQGSDAMAGLRRNGSSQTQWDGSDTQIGRQTQTDSDGQTQTRRDSLGDSGTVIAIETSGRGRGHCVS
jgi:hypothetical protein